MFSAGLILGVMFVIGASVGALWSANLFVLPYFGVNPLKAGPFLITSGHFLVIAGLRAAWVWLFNGGRW